MKDVQRGKTRSGGVPVSRLPSRRSVERCIVVDDAGAGIEAARRATMRRIGVSHDGKDLQADQVVQVTRAVRNRMLSTAF